MLWLCISLPQLPLEALRAHDDETPTVVTACEGSTRWVICCNEPAERSNLKVAMNYTVALSIHPQVQALERKPQAEQSALERLAAWAYQFSSTVVLGEIPQELRHARTTALWMEIGASLKLFGGFRHLVEHLERELEQLHYTYRLGIAPTLEGAALLARAEIRVAITTPHALYTRIRALPISKLALASDILHQLHTAGVLTIGLLIELPRAAVAKRFGPEIGNFLDRLTGEAADPRPAFRLPDKYDVNFEFDFEIRSTEALLFPLRRLLREFAGFLRARDTGVQHFTLALTHRDLAATQLRIGLSMADRNADIFFALAREQLERVELSAPTVQLRLSADQFAAPSALQADWLSGALQQSEKLSHTIDRIAARLGRERIHSLRSVADHRPESCWRAAALDEVGTEPDTYIEFPDRPLWLLPEPKPLQLSALPQITSGPERIESGWWDTGDVQRDYYVVRTTTGADLWVFRNLADSGWYLHGFWS